jgi:hypothetical protein
MLEVFVLGHNDEMLKTVPEKEWLHKVNLSLLGDNELAESRIFLSPIPSSSKADYVGFATWRWNKKFGRLPLEQLNILPLKQNVVWAAMTLSNWYLESIHSHSGMVKYLVELARITNLQLINKTAFWCNCFICHRDVYFSFEQWFRKTFNYFNNKYRYNYEFEADTPYRTRKPALFYERFACMYFTNLDVEIRQI